MKTKAFLQREHLHYKGNTNYFVQKGTQEGDDDGLRIDLGDVVGAWYEIPLPPCPDCGGTLVWAEAGYVPGTRQCTGCGSLFSVQTKQSDHSPQTNKYRFGCDRGHVWYSTMEEDKSAEHKCPICGEYWQ